MGRTVLLTGVAGFIGARTAEFLLDRGDRVIGVDNLNEYYDIRLKQHRLERLVERPGFSFVKQDIEAIDSIDALFAANAFDVVFNLAARAGVRYSIENPFVYLSTNALGTLNLLELMRRHRVRKMVLASTSSLYVGQTVPFQETLPVNTPISPYAASKKAAEVMAFTYHHVHGLDVAVVRYFTVYGPAGRPDMSIFRFIKWIDEGQPVELFGDGSQSRDFTYVDDIALGTILAERIVGYEIINLGGGKRPVTLLEIIALIEKLLGKKAVIREMPFHRADIRETGADISKASKTLDWKPKVDLETGIRHTVEWYIKNRHWLHEIRV